MSETIHRLIENYGLIAVFIGCIAEGETAAILAGFFAHQHVFGLWQAFAATFLGAFVGDVLFFLTGRWLSGHSFVASITKRPGFDRALQLVREHPAKYVILNRYAYGFRLIGGVAAGLSDIAIPKFIVLNAISSLIWTALFGGIGYFFGLGAEALIGTELAKHERLLIGLGIGLVALLVSAVVAHRMAGRGGGL